MSEEAFWEQLETASYRTEADVEQFLLVPLLIQLGYLRNDIVPKVAVDFQHGRKRSRGRKPEADFVAYAGHPHDQTTTLVVVEAKNPTEGLQSAKDQAFSYAYALKAPLVLLSNGLRLEVWQCQLMADNVQVFECEISALRNRYHELESMASKLSCLELCKTIEIKRLDLLSSDFSAYEGSELSRAKRRLGRYVVRRLIDAAGKAHTSSEIVSTFPQGAVIFAPSGCGKTTLSAAMLCGSIEALTDASPNGRFPIEIFLPDLVSESGDLEKYAFERVGRHVPHFSISGLRSRARHTGLLILADGYDRVNPDRQEKVLSELANFLRDYPRSQLFLFSRPQMSLQRLQLPYLKLANFQWSDILELSREWFKERERCFHLIRSATDHIQRICEQPLMADMVLNHCERFEEIPKRIAPLYEEWLTRILDRYHPLIRESYRQLLHEIAEKTIDGPISISETCGLVNELYEPRRVVQDLIDSDAVYVRGNVLELTHESLADYLRAIRILECSIETLEGKLRLLKLDRASQLPFLLVVAADSPDARRVAWRMLIERDLSTAISCLYFEEGELLTPEVAQAEDQSRKFLSDIETSIRLTTKFHFKHLASSIISEIAGRPLTDMCIRGRFEENHISYHFADAGDDEESEAQPLRLYGRRIPAQASAVSTGYAIGIEHVRQALLSMGKQRELSGRQTWQEEKAIGRLRHLQRAYGMPLEWPMKISEAVEVLYRSAGHVVLGGGYRHGQHFLIDTLIADLKFLQGKGLQYLRLWWSDLPDEENENYESVAATILNEYYKRVQQAYREIIDENFEEVKTSLVNFRMMPLRYEVNLVKHSSAQGGGFTLRSRRLPVATYDEAGADVSSVQPPGPIDWQHELNSYSASIDELLIRFGRWFPERQVRLSYGQMPDFEGNIFSASEEPDETAVVREAMAWFKEDLDLIFGHLHRALGSQFN